MSNDQAMQALSGWSTGYSYALAKNKENEVKQGKNYYFSALSQISQIAYFSSVASEISKIAFCGTAKKAATVFANVLPILSIPFCLCFALSKHGKYEKETQKLNAYVSKFKYYPRFLQLPEKLNPRTEKVMNFFAEHLGDMVQVAMITGSIALIALGNLAYGATALSALSYQAIDNRGYIPRKVSLFVETYMPTVSLFGMLCTGILLNRVIAAVTLPSHLSSSFIRYTHEKVDLLYRKLSKGPTDLTLEDINAPLQNRKNLTFEEIQKILKKNDGDVIVDPSHLMKWANVNALKVTDGNFDKLLTHFNSVDWIKNYNFVKEKLRTDERFLDMVSEKCHVNGHEKIKKDIDAYIEQLADKETVKKEVFVANYIKAELVMLVKYLKGEKRVKGLQSDLDDAINNCKYIIPYLDELANRPEKQIDFEDILLQLAVEAGAYCARGIKGTMGNIVSSIIRQSNQIDKGEDSQGYDSRLRQALQDQRMGLVENTYQQIINEVFSKFPSAVTQDKHAFDVYRILLSYGFTPLTDFEKREFGFAELIMWEKLYQPIFRDNINTYKENMMSVFKEIGNVYFSPFLMDLIKSNTKLTAEEKKQFMEKFSEDMLNEGEIAEKRYQRLVLFMLGILKCK